MSIHPVIDGISPANRRGACPSLSTPMQTGDGLIVRLAPMAPGFTPRELLALCDAARTFGNGILDVTARGNLQIRGLMAMSVAGLRTAIVSERIDLREGLSIDTPPLAGLDLSEIGDSLALAADLRRALAELGAPLVLAPKLSVVIDGCGALSLDGLSADLRLRAVARKDAVWWRMSLGGDRKRETSIGPFDAPSAVCAIVAVLQELAALGPMARARDLDLPKMVGRLSSMAGEDRACEACEDRAIPVRAADIAVGVRNATPLPVGIHNLGKAGLVLGVGLAYGQIEAGRLAKFVRYLAGQGVSEIRLCPGRAILVPEMSEAAIIEAQDLAAKLGMRVCPDDPANHVAACSGRGACASAFIDTHATADRLIARAPSLFDGSVAVHVSGCAKGCARPSAAGLALVGLPDGLGLVVNGVASAAPIAICTENALDTVLHRLEALIAQNKQAGESAQTCLTRLQSALAVIATERE